jgi:hypothetical protein
MKHIIPHLEPLAFIEMNKLWWKVGGKYKNGFGKKASYKD